MRHRVIHLVNPKTDSMTTRPLYLNRALYSPIAGLLAVAAAIPRDRYEVVLTDENIESVDFDLQCDLVGISAMTAYVNRGYEIADEFRRRGVPVIMGGVHPSFMAKEALGHCDAVCIGEAELVIPKILDDLEQNCLGGTYQVRQAPPDDRRSDAALRPHQAKPLRQQDIRADLARLPPGLHVLLRAADERAQVPLSTGRRGDVRGRQLRIAHDLHQRRGLLRYARAAEGSDAGPEGPQHSLASRRHLKARTGRRHAGARGGKRLHHAFDRVRVDFAGHA